MDRKVEIYSQNNDSSAQQERRSIDPLEDRLNALFVKFNSAEIRSRVEAQVKRDPILTDEDILSSARGELFSSAKMKVRF